MRKLAWAAVGFATAVFLAEFFLPTLGLPYISAALAFVSPAVLLCKGNGRRRLLILLLSAALGCLCWWAHYELRVAPGQALAGQTVTVTARVTDYPEQGDGYTKLEVRILSGAPRVGAVLYLYDESAADVMPGDLVTADIRVGSVTERGSERVHTYTSRNQNLKGTVQNGVSVMGRARFAWLYFPKTISRSVKALCDELFPAGTAAFMKALLTGDTAALKQDTESYGNMRLAGMLHIVAVSGMHVFLLCALLELALGKSRRTSLLCLPVMLVFLFMAGCTPSVVRAVAMQSILMAAPVFGREEDGVTSASASLLLMLVINPMAIGSAGLQLSFSCMAGLTLLLPAWMRWTQDKIGAGHGAVHFVADSLGSTLCASAFSLPIAAWYYGTIAIFSPLANLLTLTAVEVCFGAGYVVCILGAIVPALAKLLAWLVGWLVRWCFWVYGVIAGIPYACLYTVNGGAVLWLASVYGLLIMWVILRKKRGIRIRATIPASLCAIGLCVLFLTNGVSLRDGNGELAVLDVGQGECVALLTDSAAVLVDCGGSGAANAGDVAANYLLSQGKTEVELLVLTHLHADHTNGVKALLARLPVHYLILPEAADDEDDMLADILAAAEKQGTQVVSLSEPCTAELGGLSLSLLLPQAGSDENERGIVALAETDGWRALLMGDAGEEAELALLSEGLLADVDVLVVGHHGSKTASSAIFLRAVAPETAVVSVGYNSYGLPAEEIMERLGAYCPTVLRTDEEGNIVIQMEAKEKIYG